MTTRRTWVILPLALLSAAATGPVSGDHGWILEERSSSTRTLSGLDIDTAYQRGMDTPATQLDRLVRVHASVAGSVAMQQAGCQSGTFQMLDVDSLALPLDDVPWHRGPRNLLLLLQGLQRPLRAGDGFDLTLYYEHAEPHTLSVKVNAPRNTMQEARDHPLSSTAALQSSLAVNNWALFSTRARHSTLQPIHEKFH